MIGGSPLVGGPAGGGVLHFEHFHQELGELVGLGGQSLGFFQKFWVFGEQLQIEHPQRGGAGARRHNNVLAISKLIQDPYR